jgi:hypothetical protein
VSHLESLTYLGIAVPHSKYTAVPARAIAVPNTHMSNERPTLPDNARIVLGVAKIPVPMTRLKIKSEALKMPIWRRLSGDASKTFPSSK